LAQLTSILASEQSCELQFIPGEKALFTSVTNVLKQVHVQDFSSTFVSRQDVSATICLDEESHSQPLVKRPFALLIALENIRFTFKNNDRQISYDACHPDSCLEMAEAKTLLGRPLKFTLNSLESPLSLDPKHQKLLGSLALFSPSFMEGLFEEDVKDLFAFADQPLYVGATCKISKKIDADLPIELLREYVIKEITPQKVIAGVSAKIEGKKCTVELAFPPLNESRPVSVALRGEAHGEIAWDRENSLFFDMDLKGAFKCPLKALGVDARLNFDLDKRIVSKSVAESGDRSDCSWPMGSDS